MEIEFNKIKNYIIDIDYITTINNNKYNDYNDLYVAQFQRYENGFLYYLIELEDGYYEFPIAVTEKTIYIDDITLTKSLKDKVLSFEVPVIDLLNFIEIAINENAFIQTTTLDQLY